MFAGHKNQPLISLVLSSFVLFLACKHDTWKKWLMSDALCEKIPKSSDVLIKVDFAFVCRIFPTLFSIIPYD